MDLAPGTKVDRYVVEGLLGRGGMAVVYRVRHSMLGHAAALKILLIPSPQIRQRLLQEGRVQSNLRHPNVVAVTDIVDVDGAPGLVMEFVDGPSLDRYLEENRVTLRQADSLARGVIRGVAAAHAAGTIHRDLKPGNILLAIQDGEIVPKITDFGLAKAVVGESGGGAGATRSGLAMGTPAYMAPEQIQSARGVDQRADVFSLGAILYELVTGQRAFPGDDVFDLFDKIRAGTFTPVRQLCPTAPERVVAAIRGALQIDREQRIPSALALLEAWTGEPAGARAIVTMSPAWDMAAIAAVSSLRSGPELDRVTPEPRPTFGATLDAALVEEESLPVQPSISETMDPEPPARVLASVASLPSPVAAPPPRTQTVPPPPAKRSWLPWVGLLVVLSLAVGLVGVGAVGLAGAAAMFVGSSSPVAVTPEGPGAENPVQTPSIPTSPPPAPLGEPAPIDEPAPIGEPAATSPSPNSVAAPTPSPTPGPTPSPEPVVSPPVAPPDPGNAPPAPGSVAATGHVEVQYAVARSARMVTRPDDHSVLKPKGNPGATYPPGKVPAGLYELWTTFGDAPPRLMLTVDVKEGASLHIFCYTLPQKRCEVD